MALKTGILSSSETKTRAPELIGSGSGCVSGSDPYREEDVFETVVSGVFCIFVVPVEAARTASDLSDTVVAGAVISDKDDIEVIDNSGWTIFVVGFRISTVTLVVSFLMSV